jgi:ribosome biogenesis GTPase A
MMQEDSKLVDLIIELADARIPMSSRNPDIDALFGSKKRILLLCKADLADPARTDRSKAFYESQGLMVVPLDARTRRANDTIRAAVNEACKDRIERDRRRGIIGRPLRAMVVGIPNVGKSTFINSFVGKASAKTGNKPGVTRGKQWIRGDRELELLDTPGILWPKYEDPEVGVKLALTGAIREEILDADDLTLHLLCYMNALYPGLLMEKYGGDDVASIAAARNLLRAGGEPDRIRTQNLLLNDLKNGKTGRITLDRI